ncbi:MAG TPA: hydrogenase nickel incorporation protein HypB [Candidatus Bathyarchaeia archaeon]|nr:hydrogenase nickel incorporation protein HypB [Candidatus Bathyarchaeia archaeon]
MTHQIDVITSEEGEMFDIELEADLLKANREIASENHRVMKENEIVAIDVMGSVGSGKTSLIKSLISSLKRHYRIAVIEGDVTTTIDADLIAVEGVPAIQVNTGKECHLDANLIRKALNRMKLSELDLIFIENVGNLICPAEFPLGSDKRLVVISVTEGPYMVVKHPLMFRNADAVAINKADLAAAMEVNPSKLEQDIAMINPKSSIVTTSCRNGLGILDIANALGLDS